MKTAPIKDQFHCETLRVPEDLALFFKTRWLAYEDINEDVADVQAGILQAMKDNGPVYFLELFCDKANTSFALFDQENKLAGSARISCYTEINVAEFDAHHILSSLRGHKLIDLLYDHAEQYVRQNTDCHLITLQTKFSNSASQKEALRNGYAIKSCSVSYDDKQDRLYNFEKALI